MTKATEKILADALALEPDEQLSLAETLIESAAISSDPKVIAAWEAEIGRRLGELESGEVCGSTWKDVRARLVDDSEHG